MAPLDEPVADSAALAWSGEPGRWEADASTIHLVTDGETDFWRTTHYGFIRDNGHFAYRKVSGDFVAEVRVRADYRSEFDQAGLMVRLDAERWMKCGVEFAHGRHLLSAVVTHGVSDWSQSALREAPQVLAVRVRRAGDSLTVDFAVDGGMWATHRLAFFPPALPVGVGPMAASPTEGGMAVTFTGFTVQPV
ncbi:MAG: DUF1349 domain-containing protein [Kineosporiaceae bacterium]